MAFPICIMCACVWEKQRAALPPSLKLSTSEFNRSVSGAISIRVHLSPRERERDKAHNLTFEGKKAMQLMRLPRNFIRKYIYFGSTLASSVTPLTCCSRG
jgi:hypothetical protein